MSPPTETSTDSKCHAPTFEAGMANSGKEPHTSIEDTANGAVALDTCKDIPNLKISESPPSSNVVISKPEKMTHPPESLAITKEEIQSLALPEKQGVINLGFSPQESGLKEDFHVLQERESSLSPPSLRRDNESESSSMELLPNGCHTASAVYKTIPFDHDHSDACIITVNLDSNGLPERKSSKSGGSASSSQPSYGAESLCASVVQVFIPFLIAGFGNVGAGLVLDVVQHWTVFVEVSELFVLVPTLLGLKGNLEMTMAARLATQANLGHMAESKELWKMICGNMVLIQCQATVVGFLASILAFVLDWAREGKFVLDNALVLCASSLVTANIACFLLGIVMVLVIVLSSRCHVNPDNIATPIAASLGDVTTLALLAGISKSIYAIIDDQRWVAPSLIGVLLSLTFLWGYLAFNNRYTHSLVYSGWLPVLLAMLISSGGGFILDYAANHFEGIAVFQPVINGLGGNLVAVHASRMSTYLHRNCEQGVLPPGDEKRCNTPCYVFFGNSPHSKMSVALLLMAAPGHLVFTFVIRLIKGGSFTITAAFLVVYLFSALFQVFILLYFAYGLVHLLWSKRIDPDSSSIPILTALGDFLGTALLTVAFLFLYGVGDPNAQIIQATFPSHNVSQAIQSSSF